MTYSERKEKEGYLLYLIEQERLTDLEKVANGFGCSKRTIKRMLSELRAEGKNIIYCRKKNRYYIKK
ncbi:DeoR family transcriptional regulator [Formosa haliotis]|uniref:DeoR family transcriptional regulator n=1 Tax=Formosa haliotis TaxID=1555194 RepID=UPI00082673A5|nr:DeoR family transcriptional regulator [Formosa haliotis]